MARHGSGSDDNETPGIDDDGVMHDVNDDGDMHDLDDDGAQHADDDGPLHDLNDDNGIHALVDDDLLRGGDTDDRIFGRTGDDHMDGGHGVDTVVFHGNRGSYSVGHGSDDPASRVHVSGSEGSDTLDNVERLQFDDRKVAFDLGTGEAAGDTVRLIGAAFGAEAVRERHDYVGVGLELFDSGHSLHDVAERAAKAMGLDDDGAFVDTVYRNVLGTLPGQELHDYFESLLEGHGGTMTRGQLLELAASTDANAEHIGLVGLQQSGVDFL